MACGRLWRAEGAAHGFLLAYRSLGIRSFEPLRRSLGKTLEMQKPDDVSAKTETWSLVVKLMDYHIAFAQMMVHTLRRPRSSFSRDTRKVNARVSCGVVSASRVPAARTATLRMMAQQAESGAIAVRFEDVVTRPIETCPDLSACAGPDDGKFEFKVEPYRTDRMARKRRGWRVDPYRRRRASQQIDASVLRGEAERLSDTQRRAIWNLTGAAAARLGYTEASSLSELT
jgi:hypothetical protein